MEAAPSTLYFTGERVVLLLYLSRIVFSLIPPLLPHAFALCLVSFAALFAEISVEGSQHAARRFWTRPGASSGIFLGAITLPTVFFSRLTQMHRGVSAKDVVPEELEYLNMQYWAVIVSCFSVLLFLLHIRWQRFFDKNILWSWMSKDGKFSLVFSVSSAILLIVFGRYCSGLPFAGKLLWITYYGLASVKLFNFIISSFPNCASLGEVFLVTGGLVLFVGDLLAFTAYKLKLASFKILVAKSEISAVVQGMLFGLLLLPLLYKLILFVGNLFTQKPMSDAERDGVKDHSIGQSAMFYTCFTVILMVSSLWIQYVQDLNVHPLQWVFYYVLTEKRRLLLSLYWISLLFVSVLKFYNISKHSKIERILLRKYYHLVAVLIFVPALLYEPGFLDLSFGAALAVFLVLETIRVWKIWPLGQHVHKFMNAFTDHRDSDILIVSHFSLLLGCALPKWLCSGFNDRPLAPFAGILSLGIGDTMASVVGYKYGVLRWSKTGKKTIEGTAAGISSVLLACSVLVPLFATTNFIMSQHWLSLLVAVTISGLLEAYTAQLDNAFMPLVFYTLLCL